MAQQLTVDLSPEGAGQEVLVDSHGLPTPKAMGVEDVITDPDVVNAVTARAMRGDDEEPVISGPPDGSVTLLAGYVDGDGVRHTSAEIRELRGRDEEVLARAVATGDTARFIDAIVRTGVVRIGDVEDDLTLKRALDSLLLGDRALICLQVRRLAYGDTMELDIVCPLCQHEFVIGYSFSEDVPLKAFAVEGEDDPTIREFPVVCPSGSKVTLRLVDGLAQKKVYTPENITKKNDEERNTILLAEVISEIDGVPLRGSRAVLDMPARDRRFLLKWTVDGQFGPQYDKVEQECPDCQRSFPLGVIDIYQMFRGA